MIKKKVNSTNRTSQRFQFDELWTKKNSYNINYMKLKNEEMKESPLKSISKLFKKIQQTKKSYQTFC